MLTYQRFPNYVPLPSVTLKDLFICTVRKILKETEIFFLISLYIHYFRPIGIMVQVFANGRRNQGSIPGGVIPKTQKIVVEDSLLNTQYYKVWIKGKWSNPGERSSAFP